MFTKLLASFWVKMHLNNFVLWFLYEKTKRVQILKLRVGNCLFLFTQWVPLFLLKRHAIIGFWFHLRISAGASARTRTDGGVDSISFFCRALNWNLKCTGTDLSRALNGICLQQTLKNLPSVKLLDQMPQMHYYTIFETTHTRVVLCNIRPLADLRGAAVSVPRPYGP